jgi:predicted amidophosphoribosyltransferase
MLSWLLRCVACGEGDVERGSLPLCRSCQEGLVSAGSLCPRCGGAVCQPDRCLREWAEIEGADSYSARYLCLEPGYRVLKRWKVTQSSLLEGRVLDRDPGYVERLRALDADLVTWVPQARARSWRLGGCPAARIARWTASLARLPCAETLLPPPTIRSGVARRQAQLGMTERRASVLRFRPHPDGPDLLGKKVILTDDFVTTGKTVRSAARSLKSLGAVEVHVVCLGVRLVRQDFGRAAGGSFDRVFGKSQRPRGLEQGA